MRIGWIQDPVRYVGGAELTAKEFRAAVPRGVEIVDCQPGGIETGLDGYVAHNVVHYAPEDFQRISAPVTWFHHDLSPWIKPDVRRWLDENASHIFCSPIQRDRYGLDGKLIPPPIDIDRYKPTRQARRHRKGNVTIAQWRSPAKGGQAVAEWADQNGLVFVYGAGDYIPLGASTEYLGAIAHEAVASILLRYKTFVFLPFDLEPFCRCVVEAWASGLELVVNKNIGAAHWIANDPDALTTASEDFWNAVTQEGATK